MSGQQEPPPSYPRAVPVAPESDKAPSTTSTPSGIGESNPCYVAANGKSSPQVVVYMDGREEGLWKTLLKLGALEMADSITRGNMSNLPEALRSLSREHLRAFYVQYIRSGFKEFSLAVRESTSKPTYYTWVACLHWSVASAMQSAGMPAPNSFQAAVLKQLSEPFRLHDKEGLFIQGAQGSGKTTILETLAISTAIEASEHIVTKQYSGEISRLEYGEYSVRKDENAICPTVIIIAPTVAVAHQMCDKIKNIARVGSISIHAKAFDEDQGSSTPWDYIAEHNGRCFPLSRHVDIVVCTISALNKLIKHQAISMRSVRVVIFDDCETLFGKGRLTADEADLKRALQKVFPKKFEAAAKDIAPHFQTIKNLDVELMPLQLLAENSRIRVVASSLNDLSPALTKYIIEKVFKPFGHSTEIFVKGVKCHAIPKKEKPSACEDGHDDANGCDKKAGGEKAGEELDCKNESDTGSEMSENPDDEGGVSIRDWF